MQKTNNKKPGVLRSSIELELSTKEAVALFYGRKSSTALNAIVGLNAFAQKVKYINNAAHNDDPYADYFLLEVEAALKTAKTTLITWQDSLTGLSSESLLTINQGSSTKPVALETSFASVYANIGLELLKRADNLLLTLYALKHTGLINRAQCNGEIIKINKLMRRTLLAADGYKFFSINRKDVKQQTARYRQAHLAMKFTKELPAEILDKTLRAEHAPNIMLDPNDIFRKKPVKKPLEIVKKPVKESVKALEETPHSLVYTPFIEAKEPVKELAETPIIDPTVDQGVARSVVNKATTKPVETPVKEPVQTSGETPEQDQQDQEAQTGVKDDKDTKGVKDDKDTKDAKGVKDAQ